MRSKRISRQEKEAQATEKKTEREELERYYENIPTVKPYSFFTVEDTPEGLREVAELNERLNRKAPK